MKQSYHLEAPSIGVILNSGCNTRKEAETLLSDRIANGDAFLGEYVVSGEATPRPMFCAMCGNHLPNGPDHECVPALMRRQAE